MLASMYNNRVKFSYLSLKKHMFVILWVNLLWLFNARHIKYTLYLKIAKTGV